MNEREMFIYPALYNSAGDLSATSQRYYHGALMAEYFFLVVAAVLSMNLCSHRFYFLLASVVFILLMGLLVYRVVQKPEQDWYKGRALAESIKTMTWRYCMGGAPFCSELDERAAHSEFRNQLKEILDINKYAGQKLSPDFAQDDQITSSMVEVRLLSLREKKDYYLVNRIKEQRNWYVKKAGDNKRASRRWAFLCGAVYLIVYFMFSVRVGYPDLKSLPIDPLLVLASSMLGWMQIKRFNELASAYTLTAHEIGILQSKIIHIDSDSEFSSFVSEAELAFSREHTQWVARN